MPISVKTDGKAAPFLEKGKAFYFQRRGQLDMACATCHIDYPGKTSTRTWSSTCFPGPMA